MTTIGIICEYNPFHNGHLHQLQALRKEFGEDTTILCLMSGNFTQRGEPAIFAKEDRAKAAVLSGADLVLELPVNCALSSAEGFASGGVRILSKLGIKRLSFGTETGDRDSLMKTAALLLSPELDAAILRHLETGCSYGTARQLAAEEFGVDALLKNSNDILGVEYCKAILKHELDVEIYPITRPGGYLDPTPDSIAPSALSLRLALQQGLPWEDCVPPAAAEVYRTADRYSVATGERAILARLRSLTEAEYATLPYGSEGLWRKLMQAGKTGSTLEEVISLTKSKRYARSRIQRMVMCAYLGLTARDLEGQPTYVRTLAFSDGGRALLRELRQGNFPIIDAGEMPPDSSYAAIEQTCSDLYGLFLQGEGAKPGGREQKIRNFYWKK